jgi:hypothetical protein
MREVGIPDAVGVATDVTVMSDGEALMLIDEVIATAVGVAIVGGVEVHACHVIADIMEDDMDLDIDIHMEDIMGLAITEDGMGGAATKEVTTAVGLLL